MDGTQSWPSVNFSINVTDVDFRIEKIDPEFQDSSALLYLVTDCIKRNDLHKASEVHAGICGFLKRNSHIGTALFRMYVKSGVLAKAQEVFDELPERDVVSWTILIDGYTQVGLGNEALNCLEQMRVEGFLPDIITFICLLKACSSIGALEKGKEIHSDICRQGLLEKEIVLGNAMVDMYAKCGALAEAQEVFEQLPSRDIISWTTLITGYAQHGLVNESLEFFRQMCSECLCPDTITFICLLKACGIIGAAEKGEEIHAELTRQGLLGKEIMLSNALLDMYSKCGVLLRAQQVFNEMPERNAVSWNSMIAGYSQHGLGDEALKCFQQMHDNGFAPDIVTFICIVKACGSIGVAEQGEKIHAHVVKQGLLEKNISLGTVLVDMYAKCGKLVKAQVIFDKLPARNVVSWTTLLAGFAQHGLYDEALKSFEQMQEEGIFPNTTTFACILKVCGCKGDVEQGVKIHAQICTKGLLEKDIILNTALVDMYAKCGALAKAKEVFIELPRRDVATWNALITGYVQYGQADEALKCFGQMQVEGVTPDLVTFICSLKACSSLGATEMGKWIHMEVSNQGFLGKDVVLSNAVVDMYFKFGTFTTAQHVFDGLCTRDVASWNVLIAGYAQHGLGCESLKCFGRMKIEGFLPNTVTFICVCKVCGSIGAVEEGEEIHAELNRQGLLGKEITLDTALVDMYAKSGLLARAQKVFDELPTWDIVSWNVLIAGYAQVGKVEMVLDLLNRMVKEHAMTDTAMITLLLTACSHAGLVEEGQIDLVSLSPICCIIPTLQHYNCMVDLFSRAGYFNKAISMIKWMPPSDSPLFWVALLGACQKWINAKLGKVAYEHALQLNENSSSAYVCMSNIYANTEMQDEATV